MEDFSAVNRKLQSFQKKLAGAILGLSLSARVLRRNVRPRRNGAMFLTRAATADCVWIVNIAC
jgi:hypothetical protein